MSNRNMRLFLGFLLILLITVGLSAVSASDTNQTDMTLDHEISDAVDNHFVDNDIKAGDNQNNIYINSQIEEQYNDYDGINTTKTTKNIKSDSIITVETYNELRNEIIDLDGDSDSATIFLEGDDEYSITLPITYGDEGLPVTNLLIEGNGKTIDGSDAQLFMTVLDGFSLTINNVTIKNIQGINGSAFISYGNLTITNSIFRDCGSTEHGGLIFLNNTGSLKVENSIIENVNSTMGGVIATFSTGNVELINNTVNNVSAQQFGGLLYNYYGNVSIVNNTINNTSAGVNGGIAVMMKAGNLSIAHNELTNIQVTATNGNGGLVTTVDGGNFILDSNTITNASAGRDGAVLSNSANATVINNTIINTTAARYGMIINQNNNKSTLYIINNTITSSHSKIGGLLYNFKNATLINNTITDSVSENGGVIWTLNASAVTLSGNTITNSRATAGYGGVISINDHADVEMYNNTIINSSASKEGGVVNAEGDSLKFVGNNVSYANATAAGVIRHITGKVTFENNTISNVDIQGNGAVVHSRNPQILDFNYNNITNISGLNGAILFYQSDEYGVTFAGNNISNVAAVNGGVLYLNRGSTITLEFNEFNNITASNQGAIVYDASGRVVLEQNIVTNSTAVRGVIYSNMPYIKNNTFISNKVTGTDNSDSVIYIRNFAESEVSKNKFYNNTDYTRDMLFNAEYDIVADNVYVGNYLIHNATLNDTNISLLSDSNKTVDVDFQLRDYYNDMTRSGKVIVTLDNGETLEFEVKDNKAVLQFNYYNVPTSQVVNVTYTSEDKSYQDIYIGSINITKPPRTLLTLRVEGDQVFDLGNGTYQSYAGFSVRIIAKLTDENGNPIVGKTVNLRQDDFIFFNSNEITNSSGEAYATDPATNNNNKTITAEFTGDDLHNAAYAEIYLDYIKYNITIVATPSQATAVVGEELEYQLDLYNYDGKMDEQMYILGRFDNVSGVDVWGSTGSTIVTVYQSGGVHNLTFYVEETEEHNYAETTVTLTVYEKPYLHADDIIGVIGDPTNISVEVRGIGEAISEGEVTFSYLDGTVIGTAPVIDGYASLMKVIDYELYDYIAINYTGAGYFYDADEIVTPITISKRNATINNHPVITILNGTNLTINGTLTDKSNPIENAKLKITLIVDDEIIYEDLEVTTDSQGFFTTPVYVTATPATGYATITFEGDDIYEPASGYYLEEDLILINIVEENIILELDEITENIYYGDNVTINGILKNNMDVLANTQLTLKVNDETFNITTDEQGLFKLQYNNTQINNYSAYASYNGVISNIITFNVTKKATILTLDEIADNKYDDTINITGTLTDADSNPLSDTTVTVYINSHEIGQLQTNLQGRFNTIYQIANAGLNNVTAVYEQTENYQNSSDTKLFNTRKLNVNIDLTIWPNDVNEAMGMMGSLADENGDVVGDAEVTLKINDEVDEVLPVAVYGGFDYEYTPTTTGLHTITIIFNETDKYNQSTKQVSFNISKIRTRFDAQSLYQPSYIGYPLVPLFILLENNDDGDFVNINDEITVIINNETFKQNLTVWDQLDYIPTKGGTLNVTLIYDGNDIYEGCRRSYTLTVDYMSTRIDQLTSPLPQVNETFSITFSLKSGEQSVPEATVEVYHKWGDFIKNVTVHNGRGIFEYSSPDVGTVWYTVIFRGTDVYAPSEADIDVYVQQTQTQLTQLTLIADMTIGDSQNISYQLATLKTEIPASDQTIKVNVTLPDGSYNESYNITTDDDGIATFTFNATKAGDYTITAIFDPDYHSLYDLYDTSNQVTDTIHVRKSETKLNITPQSQQVYVDDEAKVQITLIDAETDEIIKNKTINILYLDYDEQLTIPESGILEITIPTIEANEFNIIASFDGDDNYLKSENTSAITITKYNVTLTSQDITAKITDGFNITVTVTDNLENEVTMGNMIFTIDKDYNQTITKNPTIIPVTLNQYTQEEITITYEENRKYNTNTTTITITVEKLDVIITIDEIQSVKYNNTMTITGNITDEYNNKIEEGTLDITINKETYQTQISNGTYTYNYTPQTTGTNNITITYEGSELEYNSQTQTNQFEVTKQDTTITIDEIPETKLQKDITISGTLQNEQNNPITNADIIITINDETYNTTTDDEGKYNYTYTTNNVATNNITVTYEETENYNKAENNITFTVTPLTTTIEVNPIEPVIIEQNVTITGRVLDENGQTVTKGLVSIKINDEEEQTVEIQDNKYEYQTQTTILGTNNVTLQYMGEENYTESEKIQTTFTTNPIKTQLVLDDINDAKVEDTINITGKLVDDEDNPVIGQKVVIIMGEDNIPVTTDNEGKFTHSYHADTAGSFNLTVTFNATEKYDEAANVTKTFNVNKYQTTLTLDDISDAKVGDTVKITGKLVDDEDNPVIGEEILIIIGEDNIPVTTDDEGKFIHNYEANTATDYEVTAVFDSTDKYDEATNVTKTFTTTKINTTITLNDITNPKIGDTITITGKLTDENNNPINNTTITLNINNNEYPTQTSDDGSFAYEYIVTEENDYEVIASYEGNEKYINSNTTTTFKAIELDTIMTLDDIQDIKVGQTVTIKGTLKDENGNNLDNVEVTITINNQEIPIKTNNSTFTYNYTANQENNYEITVKYAGNDTYKASNATTSFKVSKIATLLSLYNINDTKVGSNVIISGMLTDESGNKLDLMDVIIDVNGQSTTVKTNVNGVFNYSYSVASEGNYSVVASFVGNGTYMASNASVSFKASKIATVIVLDKVNDTKVGLSVIVSGKLTDQSGKALGNVVVGLNVNGTAASVKTNANGVFNYSYSVASEGNYNIIASYKGNNTYINSNQTTSFKATKTTTKISIDKIISDIKINDTIKITGQLTDENNNKLAKTNIILTINGQKIQQTTDINGKYSYDYKTTKQETLTIQATYNGNKSHTNSTNTTKANVRKIYTDLSLNKINNSKINDTIQIKGTLTDENNRKIANANIIISIEGEEKTTKTNNNGAYEYNITLKETGNYTIEVDYDGNATYDYADTVRQTFTINKLDTKLSINAISNKVVGDKTTITGKLTDEKNNPITNATITIKVNNNTITKTTNKTGQYTYDYQTNKEETVTVNVSYAGNNSYNSNKNTTSFKVTKLNTKLTLNNINSIKINQTTTISGTLMDQSSKPIANAQIILTIANTTINVKTNSNGTYEYRYKPAQAGSYAVAASYVGDTKYNKATNLKKSFTVNKINTMLTLNAISNYYVGDKIQINGKLLDENNKTISSAVINININNTVTKPKTSASGIYNYTYTADKAGTFTLKISYDGDANYNKSANITKTFKVEKIQTKIRANNITNKVGYKDSITINVTDENNQKINEGNIIIKDASGKTLTTLKVTNGKAVYTNTFNQTQNSTITITYNATNKYNTSTANAKIIINKADTKTTVGRINAKILDNVTINATVVDEQNNPVTGGKVIFKVNGVTLKDDNQNTLIAQVADGKASINYTIPKSWMSTNKSIVAVYQGTTNTYNPSNSTNQSITLSLRNAKMNLTVTPYLVKMDNNVTLTAKITEANTLLNSGVVVFKLNGVTIKDANDKPIQTKVVNGIARINYTIPDGWSAKAVKVTAVYSNSLYDRLEQNSYFNMTKTVPHFEVPDILVNKTAKTVTLKGSLLDEYNHTVKGQNTIAIKLNGVTLKRDNGKVQYFVVSEGVVNITFDIPSNYKSGTYTLELVTGARNAYEAARRQYKVNL